MIPNFQGTRLTSKIAGRLLYRGHLSLFLALLLITSPVFAERPRIGLALSGGGAKGSAHIAVLELLEANHIPVDYIAGTSIGAYVGGLYALGYSASEIKKIMYKANLERGFSDTIDRQILPYRAKQQKDRFNFPVEIGFRDGKVRLPGGLLFGQTMSSIYRSSVGNVANFESFDDLPIPFRSVATDLATGHTVVLAGGNLVKSLQASSAVPGALVPVELEGRYLVDGGLSESLPISQVKQMGADIIIAIDISSPLLKKEALGNSISVLEQLSILLTLQNIESQKQLLSNDDIYIRPDVSQLSTTDFNALPKAFEAGKVAANLKLKALRKLSISAEEYRQYRELKRKKFDLIRQASRRPVVKVILSNQSSVNDKFLRTTLGISDGSYVSEDELAAAIQRLYALDRFERVNAEFELRKEGKVLKVDAIEKSWGPNFFEMGLGWEDDLTQDSVVNLDFAYIRKNITDNGGEWRTEIGIGTNKRFASEVHLPLGGEQLWYQSASYEYQSENRYYFTSSQPAAFFESGIHRVNLNVGYNLYNMGIIETGLTFEKAYYNTRLSVQDELRYDSPGIFFTIAFDTLDRRSFPSSGERVSLSIIHWQEDVSGYLITGAESITDTYGSTQYLADWKAAVSVGSQGLIGKLSFAYTDSETDQSIHYSQLGGFLNLSGYHTDALIGNSKIFGALAYQYDLGKSLLGLTDFPVYIGASVELGNVWQIDESVKFDDLIPAGSIFLSTDSKLGPLALGIGFSEGGNNSVYFYLGKSF